MSYNLELTPEAEEDLTAHAKAGNKKLLTKIYKIFEELTEHPQTGIGKPEHMKHDYTGFWSRRIDQKHRIVYRIDDEIITVIVLQLWGHYDDK